MRHDDKITFCRDTEHFWGGVTNLFSIVWHLVFSWWILKPLLFLHIFPQLHIFPEWLLMGLFHCCCTVFWFWSYLLFSHAFATAHPPFLSSSARGIFLVVVHSILCFGERGLLGHSFHFQSFLNVNCTAHSSKVWDMWSSWKVQDFRLP